MRAHSLTYRPEIDGRRDIATLPAVLYHAGLGIFPSGLASADAFFVISGYHITSIILAERLDPVYGYARS